MRKFGIIAAIVLGVLLVIMIVAYFSMDAIARWALRTEGQALLGVSTTASSVDLGIIRDSTTIHDLVIKNPPGFIRENLLTVKEFYIEGRLGTFASSDIQIPLVRLSGFKFDLEQVKDRINVTEVVNHINAQTNSDTADTSNMITLNIHRLIIEDISLTAEGKIVNVTGGHLDATLSRVELTNVGTESDPDQLLSKVVAIMMKIVVAHIAENPITGLSNLAVSKITSSINSIPGISQINIGRPIVDAVKAVGSGAGTLLNGVGSAVDRALHRDQDASAKPKGSSPDKH